MPAEQARHVYDVIVDSGSKSGIGLDHVGLKALNSLRMEKGYRDFGHDIDNLDAINSVGLSFTCDWDKPGGFRGRDAVQKALAEAKQHGLRSRLVQLLLLDSQPMMYHGEIVFRDDVPVGCVRSASYGHTLGGAVGLAMLDSPEQKIDKKYIESGCWTVEVAGKRYPARLSLKPMYDHTNARIKM